MSVLLDARLIALSSDEVMGSVSSTGDPFLVRSGPGELILLQAQVGIAYRKNRTKRKQV